MPKIADYTTKEDLRTLRKNLGRDIGLLKDELKDNQTRATLLQEAKMQKNSISYRDDVLTKFDAVMKELETMREASNVYPNYRFEQNKGYGTKKHRDALKIYGISKYHRISFLD
ncbi:MAG: hypothetical protein A3A51_02420 [Candidatus Levybacteria bacterium RIFCSPLOWO2_01_FULL_39_10]|nr:MAG: hypothetical protein A3A51_02420 [Candidatus Levybacteria bacterium RIFCSPLOWO2_01_FULL_39_10]